MAKINLRDFYPWYSHDEFVDVPDVIVAELIADRRYEKVYKQHIRRNKAFYSLDAGDGIEALAIICYDDSPERIYALMEQHCRLCCVLNSLPEIQGRRVEAHYLLGMSITEIARHEGVGKSSVTESIKHGLENMRIFLRKF